MYCTSLPLSFSKCSLAVYVLSRYQIVVALLIAEDLFVEEVKVALLEHAALGFIINIVMNN